MVRIEQTKFPFYEDVKEEAQFWDKLDYITTQVDSIKQYREQLSKSSNMAISYLSAVESWIELGKSTEFRQEYIRRAATCLDDIVWAASEFPSLSNMQPIEACKYLGLPATVYDEK